MCGFLVSMRIRAAVIAGVLAMIGLGIAASPAVAATAAPARFAHAALAATDPADDGDTTLANPEEIAVTLLPGLGSGTYTAVWHVISDDTHPVSGAFTFSIGAPSATRVPAL